MERFLLYLNILCIVVAVSVSNSVLAGETLIISGHSEYPPVSWQEGDTIVGVAAEMAKTIFTELGIPYKIQAKGPWPRVHAYAQHGDIDMILAAYINPERKKYMEYSIPFMKDPVSVFVLKGNTFPFHHWEDLIGRKGNTVRGESYGKEFDLFIEQHLQVERVTTVIQNFQKLEGRRVEYAIIGLYPGLAYASVTGYKDKIEVLSNNIVEENFYMTFSRKSKFRHLLPQVNAIIKRLKHDGMIDKWITQYLAYYEATQHQQ